MNRRERLWCLGLVLVAGCCGSSHPGDDGLDSGPPPSCDDGDGDGFGTGDACDGPDCDDADETRHDGCAPCDAREPEVCYGGPAGTDGVGICRPGLRTCRDGVWSRCLDEVLPETEVCDYEDDDCDGVIDDGVASACGDCNGDCHFACAGVDCEGELEVGPGGARTAEGAIRASGGGDLTPRLIWIANAIDGLAYKVDTGSYEVMGAYPVPPANLSYPGETAMNLRGDAFVLRAGAPLVTRIDAGDCLDLDGDGTLETSTGAADVRADDECVRWSSEPYCGLDACGVSRSIALGDEGRVVWVGLQDPNLLVRLDAETGIPTGIETEVFGQPLAIVPSRDGLWLATGPSICSVSTDGDLGECSHVPHDAWFAQIDMDASGVVYGTPPLARFDPLTGEFEAIAADGWSLSIAEAGEIFTLGFEGGESTLLTRYGPGATDPDVRALARPALGVIADLDGQLWAFSWQRGSVSVLDATDARELAVLFDDCDRDGGCLGTTGLRGDPTGLRLRRAYPELLEHAEASAVFDGQCAHGDHQIWTSLRWLATPGTGLALDVRAARSLEELSAERWLPVASTDAETGEVRLSDRTEPDHPWLEVRARLRGADAELRRLEVLWGCYYAS